MLLGNKVELENDGSALAQWTLVVRVRPNRPDWGEKEWGGGPQEHGHTQCAGVLALHIKRCALACLGSQRPQQIGVGPCREPLAGLG